MTSKPAFLARIAPSLNAWIVSLISSSRHFNGCFIFIIKSQLQKVHKYPRQQSLFVLRVQVECLFLPRAVS